MLKAACGGPEGGAGVARDLLVIVFTSEAGPAEREAMAELVEGALLGPVPSGELGAYYLRVPTDGEEYRLRAAADQLALMPQVRQVGSRSCPQPRPAKGGPE